jgi:3-hydroxypropanoate dehydrogenase
MGHGALYALARNERTLTMTASYPTSLQPLDERGRQVLFTSARTSNTFSDEPVSDEQLAEIWELARWAPTSANVQPLRIVFVRTTEGKARLLPHMSGGNQAKTTAAPVTAILAADLEFHELIPRLYPPRPEMKDVYAEPSFRRESARYNATLQAGYFVLAVRAVGLAAGPMLGYDRAGLDAEFFADTPRESVLVVNIGHPGENPWFDRLPRLEQDEVITWA